MTALEMLGSDDYKRVRDEKIRQINQLIYKHIMATADTNYTEAAMNAGVLVFQTVELIIDNLYRQYEKDVETERSNKIGRVVAPVVVGVTVGATGFAASGGEGMLLPNKKYFDLFDGTSLNLTKKYGPYFYSLLRATKKTSKSSID